MGLFDGLKKKKEVAPVKSSVEPVKTAAETKVAPRPKGGKAATLGELKASGYHSVPLREEMRHNLLKMIREKKSVFPGIIGFEDTVVPQILNAIIAGQDIIFLGERGQAKSRIMRALVNLLDEEIPTIHGCEINDDPFAPI